MEGWKDGKMERERRCNVIRVLHGAGRFGSVLVWPGLVGLSCLFKVDIRAVDARVGSQRKRSRSRRKKGGGGQIFTSFRFHSIPFNSCFFSLPLFSFPISAPQNLASLNFSVTLFFVFQSPFYLSICLEKCFFLLLSFFLSSLECRTRMRMHSSANRLRKT
jgi:hypothetical protein